MGGLSLSAWKSLPRQFEISGDSLQCKGEETRRRVFCPSFFPSLRLLCPVRPGALFPSSLRPGVLLLSLVILFFFFLLFVSSFGQAYDFVVALWEIHKRMVEHGGVSLHSPRFSPSSLRLPLSFIFSSSPFSSTSPLTQSARFFFFFFLSSFFSLKIRLPVANPRQPATLSRHHGQGVLPPPPCSSRRSSRSNQPYPTCLFPSLCITRRMHAASSTDKCLYIHPSDVACRNDDDEGGEGGRGPDSFSLLSSPSSGLNSQLLRKALGQCLSCVLHVFPSWDTTDKQPNRERCASLCTQTCICVYGKACLLVFLLFHQEKYEGFSLPLQHPRHVGHSCMRRT